MGTWGLERKDKCLQGHEADDYRDSTLYTRGEHALPCSAWILTSMKNSLDSKVSANIASRTCDLYSASPSPCPYPALSLHVAQDPRRHELCHNTTQQSVYPAVLLKTHLRTLPNAFDNSSPQYNIADRNASC